MLPVGLGNIAAGCYKTLSPLWLERGLIKEVHLLLFGKTRVRFPSCMPGVSEQSAIPAPGDPKPLTSELMPHTHI